MKKSVILIAAILAGTLLFTMCKDQNSARTETKKDAYVTNGDGAVLKKSPDAGSENLGSIPFGSKIVVTEITGGENPPIGWVQASWNSKEGWVKSDQAADLKSLAASLNSEFNASRGFLTSAIQQLFTGEFTVDKIMFFSGGQMEPAAMFFLSNGVLVVKSMIFTEKASPVYFRYEFQKERKFLKIYFDDDTRAMFKDFGDAESENSSVFKTDAKEKSITYQVKNGRFSFFNWVFAESVSK